MTAQDKCPTFLIEDTPSDEDAFGPHQRVADAMAELIESSEKGGKVIGLEGGWGAGKSTVVGFLVKRLTKNSNYTVISFDAWAHEGDPLRRTYLETLIQELCNAKWVNGAAWGNHRDEIANRRKVTTTRITPKPTRLGVVLAVSLFLVPLGTAFLSAGLRNGVTIRGGATPNWFFIIGLNFAMSPFWVLLANFARILSRKCITRASNRTDRQSDKQQETEDQQSEWSFLFSRVINETRTETIESPNPTSIEFEEVFTKLMREALDVSEDRRCLLVLDNLDRVDPESALAIWSTLQTFLQGRSYRTEDWFKRLWVVVPFDPNGLRKLWETHSSANGVPEPSGADEGLVSDSFLDKSFQIRFHVPPPVLSDWKAFIYRLAEKALPGHSQDEHHWIYRVFDYCRERNGNPPTPRELKVFINQIGAVHRQWQHQFPLKHVAFYVLQRRGRKSIIERLRDGENFPSKQDVGFLGEDLQHSLAGLAFNVEPRKGTELLLAGPIYQTLVDADDEKLTQLEENNPEGFWAVLEVVAASRLSDADPQSIAKAASCLKDSGILSKKRHEVPSVVGGISSAAASVTAWLPFDMATAKGLTALLSVANTKAMAVSVMNSVTSTLRELCNANGEEIQSDAIIQQVLTVMRQVTSLGHSESLPEGLKLPISAENWPDACVLLAKIDVDGNYWKYLKPNAEFEALSSVLESAVSAGKFGPPQISSIRVTSASHDKSLWKVLIDKIIARLNAGTNIGTPEMVNLFRGLHVLRLLGSSEAENAIKQLAEGGHTLHHFQRAMSKNRADGKAMCLFSFLLQRPGAAKPTAAGNSDEGYNNFMTLLSSEDKDVAEQFLKILQEFDEYKLLFKIAEARSKYDSLVSLTLRLVADSNEATRLFTPDIVLKEWRNLRSALSDTSGKQRFAEMLGTVSRTTQLCELIQKQDAGFCRDDAELYLAVIQGAQNAVPPFLDWCTTGLEQISEDDWMTELSDDFTCCRLLIALARQGRRPAMRSAFIDALVGHVEFVIAGRKLPPKDLRSDWKQVLDCISETSTRKELTRRLIAGAVLQNGKLDTVFFDLYGGDIGEIDSLIANDKIVADLFSPLLRERNVAGLQWLVGIFLSSPKMLERVSDESAVKAFQIRLRDCVASPNTDDAQTLIVRLAGLLNIEIPESKSESDCADESTEQK